MIYTLHESHDDMARITLEGDKLGATRGITFKDERPAMRHAYNCGYKIVKAWDYIGNDELPSLIETIEL